MLLLLLLPLLLHSYFSHYYSYSDAYSYSSSYSYDCYHSHHRDFSDVTRKRL